MVESPMGILAILLGVLAVLFTTDRHPAGRKLFRIVPLLVFAYFVPTILSNTGVIPLKSPLYDFVRTWLLPASLILLTLSVDVPAILGLGRNALTLFLSATAAVILGGPIAYLLLGRLIPAEIGDQAWKGLAALSGSWIGGGANYVAIGHSVGANDTTMSMMAVVDVAVANVWMAILLGFAGREEQMDARIGADRSTIDVVRNKVQEFQALVSRPTNLPDLLSIATLAFAGTVFATEVGNRLPPIGDIISGFTWVVLIVTAIGLGLSFTPLRNLEGAGASRVGSVFLYLLVTTIGAKAEFARVADAPALVAIGFVWIAIHATVILVVRRFLRAPIFFAAIGSQANIGGAASAPIVASAFHPALAPVGVLLAVGGYVLGTYGGLACAFLLQLVHGIIR